jgi:hypothetical protein
LNPQQNLPPRQLAYGPLEVLAVAMLGRTKVNRPWSEA